MSNPLDLYETQKISMIETGSFSEEFQIVGGDTFYGVFDNSHIERKEDKGNVQQKTVHPRILVASRPDGLIGNTTEITRVRTSITYTFSFFGVDTEGIPIIWLY